jgi:hypothetical protein
MGSPFQYLYNLSGFLNPGCRRGFGPAPALYHFIIQLRYMKPTFEPVRLRLLWILLILSVFNAILAATTAFNYAYSPLFAVGAGIGFFILLAAAGFLWLYARRTRRAESSLPVPQAIILGIFLGLLWVVEIGINNLIAPPLPARDIIDDSFWAVIGISILVAAGVWAYRSDRVWTGIVAGVWSGSVSGLFACGVALGMIVLGMNFITQDPLNVAEWAARGPDNTAPTMAAYFAFETLAGAFLHLTVLGPIMGVLLGGVGGIAGKVAKAVRLRVKRMGRAPSA